MKLLNPLKIKIIGVNVKGTTFRYWSFPDKISKALWSPCVGMGLITDHTLPSNNFVLITKIVRNADSRRTLEEKVLNPTLLVSAASTEVEP